MNRKLKITLGLLLFLYFAVYLFSLTFSRKPIVHVHERVIVAITSPIQKIVSFTYGKISSLASNYVLLIHAASDNEKLLKENQEFRQKVVEIDELKKENERLRALMQFPAPSQYTPIYADRIAFGSGEFERTLRINKGTKQQVELGMPVVNPQGIVGQVVEVFPQYSNILLLTDKSSAIDVIIQRTRSRGILKGFTQHQLSFEFLSVDEDLQVGDIVISSGLDGVYPEGIPVGQVSAVGKQGRRLFLSATVDPYVNFSKIEEVRILSPKEKKRL